MSFAVTCQGQGPDLVLVHGWGLGPRAWDPVLPLLAADFSVQAVTLPGYAGSPTAPGASIAELAAELGRQLPPGALLCGWSLGAMLALQCAARHPDRLKGLILVGANARFVADPTWPEALPMARLAEFVNALDADTDTLLKQFALLIHHGAARARQAIRALTGCLRDGRPADPATLGEGLALLGTADLRELVAKITTPTLLIHGAADPLMPLAGARRLADLLPQGHLDVFADAAHAPFASAPERFVELVRDFAGGLQ